MKQAERKAALENERASKIASEVEISNVQEISQETADESAEVSANLLGK